MFHLLYVRRRLLCFGLDFLAKTFVVRKTNEEEAWMLRNKFSQLSPENDKCLKTINKPLFFRKFVGVYVCLCELICVCVCAGGFVVFFFCPF
jgi:hypothetical protein